MLTLIWMTLLLGTCMILLIILDLCGQIDLMGKWMRFPVILLISHCVLILRYIYWYTGYTFYLPGRFQKHYGLFVLSLLFILYLFLRLHIAPFRRSRSGNRRVRILYGGRLLLTTSLWGYISLILFVVLFYAGILRNHIFTAPHMSSLHFFVPDNPYALKWVWGHLITGSIILATFVYNGTLRILFTCRRLGIVKRLAIFFSIWIPLINLFLIYYLCQKAQEEYEQECLRFDNRAARDGNNVCSLKYPLIMVHGIGFRDLRYFNYWGRIPRELSRNGTLVYYGHQNAWGTIEDNAEALRHTVEKVCQETGAEKVNIIAHSKGGLDSRYLISGLGYADHIASLTTVSTPHCGSELIDVLNKLPDKVYRLIAAWLDRSFTHIGEQKPDCYHSSKQLAPAFCIEFNAKYPDAPGVYYQSYASVMRGMLSDSLLSIPYLILKAVTKQDNDGLVTESSAHWANFRGVFQNGKHRRGISHGDMIDLKREDYRGFDVIEEYITIVTDLKDKGF